MQGLVGLLTFFIGLALGFGLKSKSPRFFSSSGTKVLHKESGKIYTILSTNMRIKDSEKGWVDAVLYQADCYSKHDAYARERDSFLESFEPIEEVANEN